MGKDFFEERLKFGGTFIGFDAFGDEGKQQINEFKSAISAEVFFPLRFVPFEALLRQQLGNGIQESLLIIRQLEIFIPVMVAQVLALGMKSRRFKELHKVLKPEGVTGRSGE